MNNTAHIQPKKKIKFHVVGSMNFASPDIHDFHGAYTLLHGIRRRGETQNTQMTSFDMAMEWNFLLCARPHMIVVVCGVIDDDVEL